MKKVIFILFVMMFAVGIAAAQSDILGPHNVNGHGCASCHAPHTGAKGNGGTNAASGENYLWGRDFYATTYYTFGYDATTDPGAAFSVSNGGAFSQTDPLFHTAACLSCHDGNQTAVVGMTGLSVETVEGGIHVPTYLNDGTESLKNDHPVHVTYAPASGCTTPTATCSPYNWTGTVNADGSITWGTDTATTNFQTSYGRPFRLYAVAGQGSYVECSSCHNPHSYNLAKGKFANVSGAVKPSAFFVRGWYDASNKASNSATQFCRSCHYSKSNEYVNVTVPTT
jgi:hypothetical protein